MSAAEDSLLFEARLDDTDSVAPYTEEVEEAISRASLWRAGRPMGGDPYEVCMVLLSEVERLHALIDNQHGEHHA
jgi:hypothetical protein